MNGIVARKSYCSRYKARIIELIIYCATIDSFAYQSESSRVT
jgi:hypothetical protein